MSSSWKVVSDLEPGGATVYLVIMKVPGETDECAGEYDTREEAQRIADDENDDGIDFFENRQMLMEGGLG